MVDLKFAVEPSITILDSVPSTMDVARDNLSAGRVRFDAGGNAFPSGVVARDQMVGRGQRGRTWFARPGECVCATYYFAYGLDSVEQAGQISFVAGLAVCSALRDLWEEPSAVILGLKWPNDILLNGKKLGGILVELAQIEVEQTEAEQTGSGQVTGARQGKEGGPALVALVGVGINLSVMDFPPELAPFATSLKREGANVDDDTPDERVRIGLAQRIAHSLSEMGRHWQAGGIDSILELWRQYDQTPGRVFETTEGTDNDVPVRGVAEGVADDGALRLRLPDGRLLNVRSASSLREVTG